MEILGQLMTLYVNGAAAIAAAWPWFWPLVGGVFGAVFGSFLNCARYRVPHGISLRQPPSHCPSCKTVLGVPDLVPILSFLALRGRCRHCGITIGTTSLWIEVACAALGAALVMAFQA
jgi:leader peptidase (prepilin peptidase) / N-methyltransferase